MDVSNHFSSLPTVSIIVNLYRWLRYFNGNDDGSLSRLFCHSIITLHLEVEWIVVFGNYSVFCFCVDDVDSILALKYINFLENQNSLWLENVKAVRTTRILRMMRR